tara:strand:- start:443 stop:1423 length:981 start_codon:yes stop_codon:yes gene_type:complete
MATLNARMRLLYDKNYFTEGAPMRRYNNPYYIASSQKLLFDILQQQKANNNKASVTSKINRTPLQPKPTLTSDTEAPNKEEGKATPKAKERTPPKSAPTKTPVTPAKKPVTPAKKPVTSTAGGKTPAKTPAKSTTGTTKNLRGGAKGGTSGAMGRKQGEKSALTDAADDDDISSLTKEKQARIKEQEKKEELSKFNQWNRIKDKVINRHAKLEKQLEDLQPKQGDDPSKNAQAILKLQKQIDAQAKGMSEEQKNNPRTKYKRTYSKAEYKQIRDALIGTNKKLKKDLRAEEAKSGGQNTPAYEAIKGRKRYYKARLAELDASNSKN